MKRSFTLGLIGLLVLIGTTILIKESTAMFTEDDWAKEPTAILSCFGYDYDVKVKLNDTATSIKGGQSEEKRLFFKTSKLAKEAPAQMQQYFLLNDGENQIQTEFTRLKAGSGLTLYVWLESEAFPSFFLFSKEQALGTVDKKFTITKPLPKDLKPVVITDAGENKAVLIFAAQPADVKATLNGEEGPSLIGLPGPILLENIKPGKNVLTVTYQADPAQTKEIKIGLVTPEWTKVISGKSTRKAVTKKFTFIVK